MKSANCRVCGVEFRFYPSNQSGKYCSQLCSHASPEWRAKQAAAKRGKRLTAETRARMSASRKGVPKPDGFGEKLSASLKGRAAPWATGPNSPWWRGGATDTQKRIRASRQYRLWRKAVLERDKHQCIKCGATSRLDVDHEVPFAVLLLETNLCQSPSWLFDIDNGRTLCRDCHKKTPTWSRKTDNLPEAVLLRTIVATTPEGVDSGDYYRRKMEMIIDQFKERLEN
jgi:5-methylcytosine-specific restriction endonuclease McrA